MKLSAPEVIALEMASRGMVSGTLKEWPVLRLAFHNLGFPTDPEMGMADMREHALRGAETVHRADGL